jgi:hypothetical protein
MDVWGTIYREPFARRTAAPEIERDDGGQSSTATALRR